MKLVGTSGKEIVTMSGEVALSRRHDKQGRTHKMIPGSYKYLYLVCCQGYVRRTVFFSTLSPTWYTSSLVPVKANAGKFAAC